MNPELDQAGVKIIEDVYSSPEINEILEFIKSKGIKQQYGLRAFLFNHPDVAQKLFTDKLIAIIQQISPNCNKSIKSIYFDKPPSSNWMVNWHQDLTINLINKKEHEGFKNWRVQDQRTIVQAPRKILENIFTIRIHLDDCTSENGALRVIQGSHKNGVVNIKEWAKNKRKPERICEVKRGGILIMKPLILHASRRTENQKNRRVIHIEFTDMELPEGLNWKEKIQFL